MLNQNDIRAAQIDALKKQLLANCMTKEARERLNTVRVAHPDTAEQVEMYLLQAVQSGQTPKVDDALLKNMLIQLHKTKHIDYKISSK